MGVRLREFGIRPLRETIGMVTQESFLFNGTIRENLLIGKPDASDAELLGAAEAANALPFIDRLPDGLEQRGGRTRGEIECRGKATALDCARPPKRSADSDARRSDGQRRHRDRTVDSGGAGALNVSSDVNRDRASAFDGRARRSDFGA